MACCTGQTKCNDTVTIGYLKSFVGNNILTTAGTVVSVTTSQLDSYCPTYAELTGGTIVPKFVDGGTNRWASNIDGISINGTYENNQVVKVQDLKLIYTRFNRFELSPSTSISYPECGGSQIIEYVFRLTKTTRGIDSCETGGTRESSEGGFDKANSTPGKDKVTYSVGNNWITITEGTDAKATATASKNGTVSMPQRSTTISASVTYKGETHNSGSLRVTQSALTGSYSEFEGKHATGITFTTITPSTKVFGCEGGTYTVSANGKYYERYKWVDSCGEIYNDVYEDTDGTEALPTQTGSFAKVECPTESYNASSAVSYTWSGITSSVTFTQSCSQSCGECNDDIVWGSGTGTATAPCEGGNVQVSASVSGVKHLKRYVSGVCQETGQTSTSQTQSITVVVPKCDIQSGKTYTGSDTTSQGGTINYTINQEGGACVECKGAVTSDHWVSQTLSAAACDTSKSTTLNGTRTTTYNNCSAVTQSLTSAVTVNFSANNTSNPVTSAYTFGDATVTVNQAAGPCNCLNPTYAFKYDDITVSCSSAASTSRTATYTKYTNYSNCPTTSETGSTTVTIPALTCNSGSSRTIQSGASATTLANASPKITQQGNCECTVPVTCFCSGLTLSSSAINWSYSSTTQESVTVTKDACIGTVNVASNNAHFTASISGTNIRIQPASTNTGITDITGVVTVSYTADTTPCTKTINLTQGNSGSCNCASVVFTEKTTTIGSAATPSSGVVMASVSFGDCSGSLGSASVDTGATSWLTASTSGTNVIIKASANTDLSNDRSGDVTVTYKANSFDSTYNCSSSFTVNQSSTPCTCDAVSTFITSMQRVFGSGGTHGDAVLFATGDTHGCGTLTATTQSDPSGMLVGGSLIVEDIDGSGYEKVRFYVKVNGNYTGVGRSAGAVITYTPKDTSIGTCDDYVFMLEQYGQEKPLAGCNDVEVTTKEVTIGCDEETYSTWGTELVSMGLKSGHDDVDLGSSTYGDGLRFASGRTDGNWFYADVSGRRISIKRVDANYGQSTPAPPRTGTVYYTVVRVESGKTVDCMSSSVTFVQDGCSIARDCSGCSEYGINNVAMNSDLDGVSKEGATFNLWDYVYGYSFCEASAFTNISVSNLPSWITYDGSTGILTVASGESQERSSSFTVKLSSGTSLNSCESVTATVRQLGTCDCNAYTINVTGNNTDYTSKTIIITYTGNIYNCGPLLGASADTLPNWITASMGTGSNTGGSITLNVSQNTGSTERSATVVVGIRKHPPGQGDELLCTTNVYVRQEPNCGCGIYNNAPSYATTIYGGSGQVAEYRLTNSGSCLSYSVSCDNPIFVASYSTRNNVAGDYVDVEIQDNTSSSGCTTGDVTFNIYTDGTLCYTDSFTVTSIIGCDPNPSGQLYNDGETAFTYDTNAHTIGSIRGASVGWGDYVCYSLSAHTDYTQYFDDISIVYRGSGGDYNINVTLKSGVTGDWPLGPTIDFYIMKDDVCGGGGTSEAVYLGGIQLIINQS